MQKHMHEFFIAAFSALAKQPKSTLAKSHNGILQICRKNDKTFHELI